MNDKELKELMHSLKSVKAPPDFLEKLNQRINHRFTFKKALRIFLSPFKPTPSLKLATLTATIILIFTVIKTGDIPLPEVFQKEEAKSTIKKEAPVKDKKTIQKNKPQKALKEKRTTLKKTSLKRDAKDIMSAPLERERSLPAIGSMKPIRKEDLEIFMNFITPEVSSETTP